MSVEENSDYPGMKRVTFFLDLESNIASKKLSAHVTLGLLLNENPPGEIVQETPRGAWVSVWRESGVADLIAQSNNPESQPPTE
jgi:hypothetical protein